MKKLMLGLFAGVMSAAVSAADATLVENAEADREAALEAPRPRKSPGRFSSRRANGPRRRILSACV